VQALHRISKATVTSTTVTGVEGQAIALHLGSQIASSTLLNSVTLAFTVPTGDSYTFASTNDPTVDATFSGGPHTMTLTAQQLRTARSTICRSPRPTTATFRCSVLRASSLAFNAWSDATRGDWPANVPETDRRSYALNDIKHWLEVFLFRFFTISQFKRSAVPNMPKISSGGSLSPRGDWRAPSDGNADVWLDELRTNIP
jgi:hypothetical protein